MTSLELLVQLVRATDRTGLSARLIDDFPEESAYIDFVAPPESGFREGGKFFPEHNHIEIYRAGRPIHPHGDPAELAASSANPTAELVWLAHELGHLESRLRGNPQPLSPEADPVGAYREELRAWRCAVARLKRLGFKEWDKLDGLRAGGLESYREGLGISTLDADAIASAVDVE